MRYLKTTILIVANLFSLYAMDNSVIAASTEGMPLIATEMATTPIIAKDSNRSFKSFLNEPNLRTNNQDLFLERRSNVSIYENLYLNTYLTALFEHNERTKEAFFQQKIDYILTEIKKDAYNFDVYLNGTVATGRYTNYIVNSPSTSTAANININKRLYDGAYSLSDTYETLNKRLADVTAINTRDRLAILGTSIYYDLYNSQERLLLYKKILDEQKNFKDVIEAKYKNGTSSILDFIDVQNDYVALQRRVSDVNYQYLQNEYVLRQSMHSKSEKAMKLFPTDITVDVSSIKDLQEQAIANSSDVAVESSLVKLRTADVLNEKKRFYPAVNFISSAGYAAQRPRELDFSSSNIMETWNLGLSVNIPIYNRDDIRLNIQRSKYDMLLEENKFSAKIRETLNETHRSYMQIMRIHEQQKYVNNLLTLAEKKFDVAKERYLKGLAQYRDYSEALNRVMEYQSELIGIDSDNVKESLILSVLTGKREFYEQN